MGTAMLLGADMYALGVPEGQTLTLDVRRAG